MQLGKQSNNVLYGFSSCEMHHILLFCRNSTQAKLIRGLRPNVDTIE